MTWISKVPNYAPPPGHCCSLLLQLSSFLAWPVHPVGRDPWPPTTAVCPYPLCLAPSPQAFTARGSPLLHSSSGLFHSTLLTPALCSSTISLGVSSLNFLLSLDSTFFSYTHREDMRMCNDTPSIFLYQIVILIQLQILPVFFMTLSLALEPRSTTWLFAEKKGL